MQSNHNNTCTRAHMYTHCLQVRRTLFNKMNAYPQKKIITFNKHTEDFEFHVNYAELDHLPVNEME